MMFMNLLKRRWLVGGVLMAFVLGSVTACGGGGGYVEVGVSAPVAFVVQPSYVAPLSFALTRIGPQAIALDWSDDPYVARFVVLRDGYLLATVNAVSLIDTAVYINATHCYQVQGYDNARRLVAASSTGCITVYP